MQLRVRVHEPLPLHHWLDWSCTAFVSLWMPWFCHAQKTLFCFIRPQFLAHRIFSPSTESWRKLWYGYYTVAENFSVTCSLCSITYWLQWWVSALAIIQQTKKSIWWDLRVSLLYRWKDRNLDDSLILFPFSKITVVDLHMGPMNFLAMSSWPNLQAYVNSYEASLKFKKKMVGWLPL